MTSDILGRIDVRLLKDDEKESIGSSNNSNNNNNNNNNVNSTGGVIAGGETGWDIFSLDYKVGMPLKIVFKDRQMNWYLQIFNFLWQLKRASFVLNSTWRHHIASIRRLREKGLENGGGIGREEFRREFMKSNILRNEMNHFVLNLEYYMMFEVIDVCWNGFVKQMKEATDIDQVIESHDWFIKTILKRTLIKNNTKNI